MLKTDAKNAEQFVRRILKSNEDILKYKNDSLEAKENTLLCNNDLIERLRKLLLESEIRLCQSEGLMHIRGIFEVLLTYCVTENPSFRRMRTVADKIEYIKGLNCIPEKAVYTKELLAASSEHNICLHAYYKTLCEEVHGLEGHSLRLHIASMCEKERLLSTRIANLLELAVVEIEEN